MRCTGRTQADSVQVLVTTTAGTSNSQPYTYVAPPPPTATSITPAVGPTTGGTVFLINGTNLSTVTSVTFANVPATIVAVNPAGTQLVGVTPPGAVGTAAVVVTGPGGSVAIPGGFTPSVNTTKVTIDTLKADRMIVNNRPHRRDNPLLPKIERHQYAQIHRDQPGAQRRLLRG